MLFGLGKKKLIGLDIGSSNIKIAELNVGRGGATLVGFAMAETPAEATLNGDIVNPEAVAIVIQGLIQELKTRRKGVATALWGSTVIVKKITIPRMDENLIGEQIRWEAEQYIPYDINEVNIGFELLKGNDPDGETMDILLVAAVQQNVYKCAETIQLAGLDCSILDVGGFALANCFKETYGSMPGEIIAIFNIGASSTNFVVLDQDEVVFCRDIPVGGFTYTQEVQKALNCDFTEAELLKISASNGEPAPEEVMNAINSAHEILLDELSGSVDFFLNTANTSGITKSYITGGGSKVIGLMDILSRSIACEKFDPFFGVKVNPKTFSQSYLDEIRDFSSIAIGLGVRSPGDS